MTKEQFLARLDRALSSLTPEERARALDYYREYIEDATEAGRSEEEVTASMERPETIAAQIRREAAVAAAAERPTPRNTSRALIAVLGLLSLPIALPLGAALIAVLIAVFAAIAAVILTIIAGIIAVAAVGILFPLRNLWLLASGAVAAGSLTFMIGSALMGIALTILAVLALVLAVRGTWRGTGAFFRWIGRKLAARREGRVE